MVTVSLCIRQLMIPRNGGHPEQGGLFPTTEPTGFTQPNCKNLLVVQSSQIILQRLSSHSLFSFFKFLAFLMSPRTGKMKRLLWDKVV